MTSLNQRDFHVVILLLIVTFAISSSLGNTLNSIKRTQKHVSERNQTTTPAYHKKNSELQETVVANHTVVDTESSTASSFTTLSISPNVSESANSTLTNTTLSESSSNPISEAETLNLEAHHATGENVAWNTVQDLLVPVPRSVSVLARLMTLSMTQLDTAFRGSSQRHPPSTSIQYTQSFHTTLLQISQKLSNAFSLASTNSEKIKSSILDAPEKFESALGYLKKFKNSSRIANFLVLPLNSLKETSDQTFELSNQIVSQLRGLLRLTDEVLKSANSSKTEKEQQKVSVITKLQSTQTEKTKTENELKNIDKEIKHLTDEVLLYKTKVEAATESLEQLERSEKDESKCYWSWDQNEKRGVHICPYRPTSFQIEEAISAKEAPQKLFESTMRTLDNKEKFAQGRREKDNKLLIQMRKLFAENGQLDDDIRLLETSSAMVIPLLVDLRTLENSWIAFVGFCQDIQDGTTKSFTLVNETIENPSSWNSTLSDVLAVQLKDTQENLSLLKTIVHSYLEGYRQYIVEIVAELEQMMTRRGHPKVLKRSLLAKCDIASRGIQNFVQNNSQSSEVDSQIA